MSTAEMSSETGAGSCAAASDTDIAQTDMAKAKVKRRSMVYPYFGQERFGKRMAISMHDRCGGSITPRPRGDRKSVVEGKSAAVRVDLGGRRIIQKKKDRTRIT